MRAQARDRIVDIHSVALIVETQDRTVVTTERTHGFGDAGKARIAERIMLGKDRDLIGSQMPHLHKIAHYGIGLLGVAGPVVEDVTVGGIAPQQVGTGERPEKQRMVFESIRQGNHRGGGSNVADEAKDLLLLEQLLHCVCGPRRLVAIVSYYQLHLPAIDPVGVVGQIERCFDAKPHLVAEFLGGAGERRRDAKPNLAIGHATDGRGALVCPANRRDPRWHPARRWQHPAVIVDTEAELIR